MRGNTKVIIADDNELYREGLLLMFSRVNTIDVVGHAADGNSLIKMAIDLDPDVVITDIKMPLIDGIEATKIILRNNPSIKVICLSMFADENLITGTIEAGASSYLLKNADKVDILNAIESVIRKKLYFCPEVSAVLAKINSNNSARRNSLSNLPQLSDREKALLVAICDGLTSKEIATQLNISFRTVEGLRTNLIDKFGVKNLAGLIVAALKNNLYVPKS